MVDDGIFNDHFLTKINCMFMRKILLLVGVMILSLQLLAQQRVITGRVLDANGSAVPNVSVTVKGSRNGTTTNAEGRFSLSVSPSTKSLFFTSIGSNDEEVILDDKKSVTVTLKSSDKSLEEVVVTTGYSREKKSQFAGSAFSMKASKTVEEVPVGAFDQALQGRAPGLLVNSGTGQPGSSANITIRGIQSISGAGVQPLYIVDGVPLPANDMQTINPNDFETITVLKDAAAAALYGSRGGLGVIVITTKKGKTGATSFNYRFQSGFYPGTKYYKF